MMLSNGKVATMLDKKLTDNEIIKALECCISGDCDNCHYDEQTACNEYMKQDALDLINRLQAENERLREKSLADDKLLNDRVAEAVNTVNRSNQKYVDALEKAFNDRTAELKTAKDENKELKSAINCFRGYEDKIKAEAYKEFDEVNEIITLSNLEKAVKDCLKELVGDTDV